tara:strand:- start:103 stop:396 length:294 start_codon:yes stop_codon:yes gene_type:complete
MIYYVYVLKSLTAKKLRTYVGYTKDLKNRLKLHNSNKGAKFTKGNKWKVIYEKKFYNKSKAMKYEFKIKNNRKLRLNIIEQNSKLPNYSKINNVCKI